MLLKIDDFFFNYNESDIDNIQHQLTANWNSQKRLGNHRHTQRDGLWDESISFSGKLLMKSVNALSEFEELFKKQTPVRATFGTGESYMIVIEKLTRTKKEFLKDGKYRSQEYSISIKRYFE